MSIPAINAVDSVSASNDGTLVYWPWLRPDFELTWYSRAGTRLGTAGGRGSYGQIALSPDSKQIGVERILNFDTLVRDLWLLQGASGILSRFTFNPATNSDPVWSPDGRQIAFASDRNGKLDLYIKAVGGSEEELVYADSDRKVPECWLKDNSILFTNITEGLSFYFLSPETARLRSFFKTNSKKMSPMFLPMAA